mmetsp:Transcript_7962/g.14132  ORF Transcript_7962/g.14132 Transcript_7962/m.14132 type:complete len:189 (+) Transcript_7962:55-621(+)|eukprot:CAMPEP_0184694120 /NCGR_PEP_ID=MMETSP0313-20130426/2174_1 /TAXON_ID=2792 /ORGANISM="Porphyridium aerugineum, Strain SAG 1380-2" /LENGTH=188 /DNA_ID=CAMNT_0027152355 /DNA_START=8 /DNA_END=574 /DNA_ORIENTATION=-
MGKRGRPYTVCFERLARAGVIQTPNWLKPKQIAPPLQLGIKTTPIRRIVFEEDVLRDKLMQNMPNLAHIPFDLLANSRQDTHISEKFAASQLKYMRMSGMSEVDAYSKADKDLQPDTYKVRSMPSLTAAMNANTASNQVATTSVGAGACHADFSESSLKLYLASAEDARREAEIKMALEKVRVPNQRG